MLKIRSLGLANMPAIAVRDVTMLGFGKKLEWTRRDDCLSVRIPDGAAGDVASAFKISTDGVATTCTGIDRGDRGKVVARLRCLSLSDSDWTGKAALFVDGKAVAQADLSAPAGKARTFRLEGKSPGSGLHKVQVRLNNKLIAEGTVVQPKPGRR